MNLTAVRTLITLAETGSLVAAAGKLHLSPAAVHKQMKQLEVDCGVRFYERTGRTIRLTAAADVLLPYLRSAVAQIEAGRIAIEEWRGLRRGLIRLGAGPTLSSHWLPRLLQQFRSLHPDLQVTVDTGSSVELLDAARRGSIDLALLLAASARSEPGFDVDARWRFPMLLVTALPEAAQATRLDDLRTVPFVGFRRGSRIDNLIAGYFARHGHEPDTIMRFDNADAVRSILKASIGYSVLPVWTIREDLAAGKLRAIPVKRRPPALWIELIHHSSVTLSPALQGFIDMALKQREPVI